MVSQESQPRSRTGDMQHPATVRYFLSLAHTKKNNNNNAVATLIFHMTHFPTAFPPLMLLLLMRCSLQRYATQSFASQLTVPIITHRSCLPSNCSFAAAKKKKPVPSFTKPCTRYWFLYSILQARGWSYCLKWVQYLACKKKRRHFAKVSLSNAIVWLRYSTGPK